MQYMITPLFWKVKVVKIKKGRWVTIYFQQYLVILMRSELYLTSFYTEKIPRRTILSPVH